MSITELDIVRLTAARYSNGVITITGRRCALLDTDLNVPLFHRPLYISGKSKCGVAHSWTLTLTFRCSIDHCTSLARARYSNGVITITGRRCALLDTDNVPLFHRPLYIKIATHQLSQIRARQCNSEMSGGRWYGFG
ncbi:hypothetical protein J6590_082413 [Homalodisca vitripennis]|nr:hypothetical protein J6590_082413 [Homalodisca vitripennis]